MSTSPGPSPERPETTDQSANPASAGTESADSGPVGPESVGPEPVGSESETGVSETGDVQTEHSAFLETPSSHDVAVRRAPKYQAFLLIGVVVGLIAAMVLTFVFQRSPEEINPAAGEVYYSPGTVFGFLLLVCIPVGVALFGLLAWIIDVNARKKVRTVRVDKLDVRATETPARQSEIDVDDDSRSNSAPHEGGDR